MSGPSENLRTTQVADLFEELRRAGKSEEEIFVSVYLELKQLARHMLAREPAGDSMQATRLLSDLWVRLFGTPSASFDWQSGKHFYNTVARAMRQLLIDHARRQRARRRDGDRTVSVDALIEDGFEPSTDADRNCQRNWFREKADQSLALNEALSRLERDDRRLADILMLRLYSGLTEDETAEVLGVSSETITKEYRKAKTRLAYYLGADPSA